jgi:K+:H+ antiporter
VWKHFGTVAIVVGSIAVGKAAIFAAIVRLFGYRRVIPLAVGLTLFQVGEFAFVLARVGLASRAISSELYSLVLNTAVATMALTPIVSGATSRIYQRLRRETREPLHTINVPATGLTDHIVIAGAGRVGRTIADALGSQNLQSVLIELDARHFQQAREAGLAAIYGDASQAVVLEAAHLSRASTLLVTVPTYTDVRAIVKAARQLRPDITIVARADGPDAVRELYAVGIDDVTSPEFEAAIEMTREALVRLAVPADDIRHLTTKMRRERYRGE